MFSSSVLSVECCVWQEVVVGGGAGGRRGPELSLDGWDNGIPHLYTEDGAWVQSCRSAHVSRDREQFLGEKRAQVKITFSKNVTPPVIHSAVGKGLCVPKWRHNYLQ